MDKFRVDDTHTVALVGHEQAGKTSLADLLLFKAKAVERKGSPDDGSSVSDFDDEEKKQKYSIDTSVMHFENKGKEVFMLDAPGKPEFVGQALGALNAVDNAIIVVSAPAGIQVNTRRMFSEATRRGLGRMIVINKIDADNVHFTDLLSAIRATFGKGCVLLNAPIGQGPDFKAVVDLLHAAKNPPAGCLVDLAASRSQLLDGIVESDEALMEKYLGGEEVSDEELTKALPHAIATGTVIPILCTSARKDIGVTELLETMDDHALSPSDAKRKMAKVGTGDKAKEVELEARTDGPFVAQVFKTLNDKFVGHLSFFRIYSGKITAEQAIINQRTGKSSRSGGLLMMQGKTPKNVHEAGPGDILAVAKIDELQIGDTLCTQAHGPVLPKPVYPTPMYGLAVEPKTRGDEQKISGSLHKIAEEDPTFHTHRDSQTKELVINGMSQLHLEIVQHRLKKRYDLEVVTHEPKVPYRETITQKGEGQHRHKKQSGGRGQFGEVHLRVYPLPRDIKSKEQLEAEFANKSHFEKLRSDNTRYDPVFNFAFLDSVVGGTIPSQFVPACEKGAHELLDRGALAGYRIQDVAVEIYFGKDHPVDSSEAAFKTAARIAFKNAFLASKPVLLEPIVNMEVTVPTKYTGSILGDLNTKRGRIENQESLPGDLAVIICKAPLAEVMRYKASLDSITQGQGSYTMEFSHYDIVPGNVQQQIVAKSKVAVDEDE